MYKQKHKQTKFKYSGENSYVANRPLQQIEIDLIDMTKIASENDGYRYAVTGVDIFSKYGWAMPIKTKQPHDALIGLKEVLDKIGIPEILYSDSEGSFNSTEFVKFINSKKNKHIFTNSHAHVVEAFNKTIKQQIYTRLEAKSDDTDKCLKNPGMINGVLRLIKSMEFREGTTLSMIISKMYLRHELLLID